MTSSPASRDAFNILFLCTHNSARSILAEGLANMLGKGQVRGYSAGSQPSGAVHPMALSTLIERGCPVDGLRSKSWDEFMRPDAPSMDIVITVCSNAAHETCPVWPGTPVKAYWVCRDPSATPGGEPAVAAAFARTAGLLERRLHRLLALPLATMEPATLARELTAIEDAIAE